MPLRLLVAALAAAHAFVSPRRALSTRPRPQRAVTRTTTKHQLAVDFPGSTIKNKIGPRSPVVLNTPFTAVTLPADPPPNPDMPWGKKPPVEMTAAEAFEAKIAARKAATGK